MSKRTKNIVAEICLYGNSQVGIGYLATEKAYNRTHGTGEPCSGRGATGAVFLACDDLKRAGCPDGLVRVFAMGGERMADIDLCNPPYFGDMKWVPATVYEVAVEDLLAAAV